MNEHQNRSALSAAGGHQLRKKGISSRALNIEVSAIKEMMLLASKLESPLLMAQGIPAEDTPRHIKDAIIEAVNGPVAAKYSALSGMQSCREAVQTRYQRKYKVNFDPDKEIAVTAGAMEGCMISCLATINPGDEVILMAPTFASHIEQVLACQGTPVFVETDEEKGWTLNVEKLQAAITPKTKMIIVTNPNNPTGAVFPEAQVRTMAKLAIENEIFILADETYDFLTYDKKEFFSFCQIPELKPYLILCASSSKEYSMTGYRLGWVIAPSDVLNHLLKFHDATTVCACVASQFGFIAAINGSQDCVKELVKGMQERRDLICERLNKVPHLFHYYQKPQGAYYILPEIKFPHENSVEAALQIQRETNVVMVPGIAFGENGKGHLRLSFGGGAARGPKGTELINLAFDALEEWGEQYLN